MGVPYNRVSVISNAIILLGKYRITSIEGGGPIAVAAEALLDQVLQADLSSPNWRFATSIATLSQVTNFDPDFANYRYAYELPADCLAVWRLWPMLPYEIFGNRIYTATDQTMKIEYRAPVDLGNMPPVYLNYLVYLLAETLAAAVTESDTVTKQIRLKKEEAKIQAMVVNSQGRPNTPLRTGSWISARPSSSWLGGNNVGG